MGKISCRYKGEKKNYLHIKCFKEMFKDVGDKNARVDTTRLA